MSRATHQAFVRGWYAGAIVLAMIGTGCSGPERTVNLEPSPAEDCRRNLAELKADYERQLTQARADAEQQTRLSRLEVSDVRRELDDKNRRLEALTRLELRRVVLFGFGEDDLAPKGLAAANEITDLLAQYPDYRIRVEGHADDRPIGPSLKDTVETNWELSALRAATMVRYLIDNLFVDPARIEAVGYGKFRPIADNATEEGRAKNRRVEVVIFQGSPRRVPLSSTP